jgi:hypothetical protein
MQINCDQLKCNYPDALSFLREGLHKQPIANWDGSTNSGFITRFFEKRAAWQRVKTYCFIARRLSFDFSRFTAQNATAVLLLIIFYIRLRPISGKRPRLGNGAGRRMTGKRGLLTFFSTATKISAPINHLWKSCSSHFSKKNIGDLCDQRTNLIFQKTFSFWFFKILTIHFNLFCIRCPKKNFIHYEYPKRRISKNVFLNVVLQLAKLLKSNFWYLLS